MTEFTLRALTGDAAAFAPFTYPKLRPRLAAVAAPDLAVGAWDGSFPAGLAFGRRLEGRVWLQSVFVAPEVRGRGLAARLVAGFAAEARRGGAKRVVADYPGTLAHRAALERVFARCGWTAPAMRSVQLVGRAGAMAEAGGRWPGLRGPRRVLAALEVAPFRFGPEDDAALRRIRAEATLFVPPDPRTAPDVAADTSLVVRRDGEVVAWIESARATRSHGPDTLVPGVVSIVYSNSYCVPALQRTGLLVAAYHRVFSRQAELWGPDSRAIYTTHPGAPAMLAMTRKRFGPIAIRVDEVITAQLDVDSAAAEEESQEPRGEEQRDRGPHQPGV